MKKRTSPAKSPLPMFKSDREVAEFFQGHSVAGLWEKLLAAKTAKPSAKLMKKTQGRAEAKSPISLRLSPEQIEAAKHIAAKKSVGYQTQLRMWIAEGISREAKRA